MNISPKARDMLEVDFHSYVKRIEVEKIIGDTEDPWPKFYRTIRFTTRSGDVLEVNCESESPDDLELVEVERLEPVEQPKPDNRKDWLAPKSAKGKAAKRRS